MDGVSLEVPRRLRRGQRRETRESLESAVWSINHMCEHIGAPDLGQVSVLDIGCGVKFTQAILTYSLPLQRYVGIDVFRDLIEFVQAEVDDPRFSYAHIDAHNELYNQEGRALAEFDRLPVGDEQFDLICLFSVFTHLAPHDFQVMLRLARQHVRPDGFLFFTLFLNETTEGGHGLMDAMVERLGDDAVLPDPPDFIDLEPAQPLKWAVYSRSHALELIQGTGWEIVDVADPLEYVQHHIVCRPV